jgi:hypothetical protein
MATDHILSMKLPAASCGVSCGILRAATLLRQGYGRILIVFIPVAAYFAEVATSATKAGSYGVFGKGESTNRLKKSASREWMIW